MSLYALGFGIVLLWAALTVLRLQSSSPPDRARLGAAALSLGWVVTVGSLVLLGLPTLFRAFGIEAVAHACERLFGHDTPGGPVVGWVALAAVGLVTSRAVIGWRRLLRARKRTVVDPLLGEHFELEDHALVLLPASAPVAYLARSGERPQVVVSTALVDALGGELDAVVEHELAHASLRHDRYRAIVHVMAGSLLPGRLRCQVSSLFEVAIEQWADAVATDSLGTRRCELPHALGRLAATFRTFGGLATVLRLEALTVETGWSSRWRRWATYGAWGSLVSLSLLTFGIAASGSHHFLNVHLCAITL